LGLLGIPLFLLVTKVIYIYLWFRRRWAWWYLFIFRVQISLFWRTYVCV